MMRTLLLCLLASSVDALKDCGITYVNMDFSCQSNPTASMTWTNAAGVEQNPTPSCTYTSVAAGATSETTAPFPAGSLRFNNAVTVRMTHSNCVLEALCCAAVRPVTHVGPSSVR